MVITDQTGFYGNCVTIRPPAHFTVFFLPVSVKKEISLEGCVWYVARVKIYRVFAEWYGLFGMNIVMTSGELLPRLWLKTI